MTRLLQEKDEQQRKQTEIVGRLSVFNTRLIKSIDDVKATPTSQMMAEFDQEFSKLIRDLEDLDAKKSLADKAFIHAELKLSIHASLAGRFGILDTIDEDMKHERREETQSARAAGLR